jgi:DMSO/TMAO reductase YedYZ molybdopterin-dependent catalytic subunit
MNVLCIASMLLGELLSVSGDVRRELQLSQEDLAKMPRARVVLSSHGQSVEYEGVWLHEVLAQAGAPTGDKLRGKALSSYVLAEAKDGYQILYSLAEVDPGIREGGVLVADMAAGQALDADHGPFRLIVAGDKVPARSARMVLRIKVVQLRK